MAKFSDKMNRSTLFMFIISWVIFEDRISVLLSDGGIVECHISLLNFYILQALHHPFTAPNPEDMDDLASARALAYDMVYNGVEVICYLFFLFFLFSGISTPEPSTFMLSLLLIKCVLFLFPMFPSDWWGKFENI